jgi:hypothetical protein
MEHARKPHYTVTVTYAGGGRPPLSFEYRSETAAKGIFELTVADAPRSPWPVASVTLYGVDENLVTRWTP